MFTTYKNGAEQEATIVTRYENGAEIAANAVYAYKNGAEEVVWQDGVKCKYYAFIKNQDDSTFSYDVLDNGRTLTYTINNPNKASTSSGVWFPITKSGGFGKVIKVKYTLTQTITEAMASTGFTDSSMVHLSKSDQIFYNYKKRTNATFSGTKYLDTEQPYIYLYIDAYSSYDITGTITNVYINDELVTFVK